MPHNDPSLGELFELLIADAGRTILGSPVEIVELVGADLPADPAHADSRYRIHRAQESL